MKAAQIVAPRRIEIIDIDQPEISSAPEGTVLVRNHLAAICGTDMPAFALAPPIIQWHWGCLSMNVLA